MYSFARELTVLMARMDVSKDQLAGAVGVSVSAVGKWLNGQMPNRRHLKKIADFFGLSVALLLTGDSASANRERVEKTICSDEARLRRDIERYLVEIDRKQQQIAMLESELSAALAERDRLKKALESAGAKDSAG